MNSELEKLTKDFLTAREIASIVGGDAKNALTKLRNIAKESKMAIEVKTPLPSSEISPKKAKWR